MKAVPIGRVSFQCQALGSSLYYLVEIKSSGSQWALLHRSSDSR
nr:MULTISPECIES: hypothetical protein [Wolbachia]